MKLKILVLIIVSIIMATFGFLTSFYDLGNNSSEKTNTDSNLKESDQLKEIYVEGSLFKVIVPRDKIIFEPEKNSIIYSKAEFELKPELMSMYNDIGLLTAPENSVVIYPTFTETAYSENGFYSYYNGACNSSCLTVSIKNNFEGEYASSRAAFKTFNILGYQYLTDIDLDKNPNLLVNYDKVILLHNEYVTRNIFDAITTHPNVIYLYPNALYAEISVNYEENTITLVRGHNYPENKIVNGFDWKYDNTHPFEFDNTCVNWDFYEIDNGMMLNCYPEYIIFKDELLLKTIKDF